MRILYIEDNTTNVILVQRVANMGKHEVINYDDGQEALDHFEQNKPDLILLDVQLRGVLTGLDVAHILRTKGCVAPIIAVTAYAMKGDRQRCLDAGCDDYLPKPISVAELVTVFKRYGDAVASGKPIVSTFKVSSATTTPPVDAAAPQLIVLTPLSPVVTPVEPRTPSSGSSPTVLKSVPPHPVVIPSSSLQVAPVEPNAPAAKLPSEATPKPADAPTITETVVNPPAIPSPDSLAERTPAPMNAEP